MVDFVLLYGASERASGMGKTRHSRISGSVFGNYPDAWCEKYDLMALACYIRKVVHS